MGRLIDVRRKPLAGKLAGGSGQEDPATRIAKYVPVEVAAAFPIIDNGLGELSKGGQLTTFVSNATISWLVLLALSLINVAYLVKRARREYPDAELRRVALRFHVPFSAVGFVLWTYIIDATMWRPFYSALAAGVLAAGYTLVAGLLTPIGPPQDQSPSQA